MALTQVVTVDLSYWEECQPFLPISTESWLNCSKLNLKVNLASTLTQKIDVGMYVSPTEFRFHTLNT